ncbi:MAG: ATP synthase F1 subunit epsilon [Parcubacteria group bacterium]|nr:MAG: ATP synthase F1 subunit epsilon [Parcubacteria group bacterium]
MAQFNLKIVTPDKVLFSEPVAQVSVSTALGQITILPNHLPLVSQLKPGEIIIKHEGHQESLMAISGGFIEILPDQVIILADSAERAEEIDERQAAEAHRRAEEMRQTKVKDAREFAFFTAQMEKEMARLRVARKHKLKGVRSSIRPEGE